MPRRSQTQAGIPGRVHQNHPGTFNRTYLKVNVQGGFYWLYLEVLKDSKSSLLLVHANTRNSTNPNYAATYRLEDFAEFRGRPVSGLGLSFCGSAFGDGFRLTWSIAICTSGSRPSVISG